MHKVYQTVINPLLPEFLCGHYFTPWKRLISYPKPPHNLNEGSTPVGHVKNTTILSTTPSQERPNKGLSNFVEEKQVERAKMPSTKKGLDEALRMLKETGEIEMSVMQGARVKWVSISFAKAKEKRRESFAKREGVGRRGSWTNFVETCVPHVPLLN